MVGGRDSLHPLLRHALPRLRLVLHGRPGEGQRERQLDGRPCRVPQGRVERILLALGILDPRALDRCAGGPRRGAPEPCGADLHDLRRVVLLAYFRRRDLEDDQHHRRAQPSPRRGRGHQAEVEARAQDNRYRPRDGLADRALRHALVAPEARPRGGQQDPRAAVQEDGQRVDREPAGQLGRRAPLPVVGQPSAPRGVPQPLQRLPDELFRRQRAGI
mmetsp:Transcript_109786/g.316087  ORF Transcript_109786/g.316087 Transcript_109786/m.316087 type:complete len:217 (+) Transcript_109786:1150-1800(+)